MREDIVKMEEQIEEGPEYPPRKVLIPATLGIALAVFLVSLVPHLLPNGRVRCADTILQDRTVLGTAIPSITNEFHSFGDIAWYEAGFLLPLCMLQLSFGRVYVSGARRQSTGTIFIKDDRHTTRVNGVRNMPNDLLESRY